METGIHNTSETGRLKKVLLHRPGQELENLMPEYLERLLFDDIPYLREAQKEHDAFADCLRQQGVEVVYLTDLVANSITSDEVRKELVVQFLNEAGIKEQRSRVLLGEYLGKMPDKQMVSTMMAGVRKSQLQGESEKLADLLPAGGPCGPDRGGRVEDGGGQDGPEGHHVGGAELSPNGRIDGPQGVEGFFDDLLFFPYHLAHPDRSPILPPVDFHLQHDGPSLLCHTLEFGSLTASMMAAWKTAASKTFSLSSAIPLNTPLMMAMVSWARSSRDPSSSQVTSISSSPAWAACTLITAGPPSAPAQWRWGRRSGPTQGSGGPPQPWQP